MDSQKMHTYIEIAGLVVTVASILSSVFGWHKADGVLGKVGRAIDLLALNVGHAKNQKKK